jgi:hypothetical protein
MSLNQVDSFGWSRPLAVVVFAVALAFAGAVSPAKADDGKGFFKVDPQTGGPLAIKADALHRDKIYSHFDAGLNRRVWAIYLGYGQFSTPLGPTSTQPSAAFEFVFASNQEATDTLRKWDPKMADAVREGATVFLKLSENQRWRIARTGVATFYDAENGYRFEKVFANYVPVGHTYGYRWELNGEKFIPSP